MPTYKNLDGTVPDQGIGALFKWQVADRLAGKRKRASGPFTTPFCDNDGSRLRDRAPSLTWIGHATFVQRLGGMLLATDPIWSTRIHTVPRLSPPGVSWPRMPKLDVVTVSHSHYDHLDLPTLKQIGHANPDTIFIVPKDNADVLTDAGLAHVVELEWWQCHEIGDLKVTLVPAQHWSMRAPWDKNKRLWGGFVYESRAPGEGTSYHAGDTAFNELVFSEIGKRFPNIDWAMLPIGAYDPVWFMSRQHMGPEEAGRAFELLGAKTFVAMHWGTFKLTDEPLGEPPERMRTWWQEHGKDPSRLWIQDLGRDAYAGEVTYRVPAKRSLPTYAMRSSASVIITLLCVGVPTLALGMALPTITVLTEAVENRSMMVAVPVLCAVLFAIVLGIAIHRWPQRVSFFLDGNNVAIEWRRAGRLVHARRMPHADIIDVVLTKTGVGLDEADDCNLVLRTHHAEIALGFVADQSTCNAKAAELMAFLRSDER